MPKPTTAMVKPVNNLVTELALSFMQSDDRFVATRVVPPLGMAEESGTYIVFDQKYQQADQSERRAYGDTFAQAGFGMSTATYQTVQYAEEHPIPDEIAASYQGPLTLERAAASWHAQQMAIRRERQFAAAYMATSIWGTDNTSGNDWDTSTGTPVTDVLTAKRTISQASGQNGNVGICGEIVYDALMVNNELEGRLQYTRTLTITEMEGLMAAALGLRALYVSKAIRNTANLAATASYSAIIDDDFLVIGNNPGAGPLEPTAARVLFWLPGGGMGQISSYYDDSRDSLITKHKQQWQYKVVSAAMGYFFSDIV